MPIALGETLPDIELPATGGKTIKFSDLRGQKVVLYFYPKDSTPGCTTEGRDFRALMPEFAALNCVIFGISRDSIKSHEKFKEKECFPFELISDEQEQLCKIFDVIKEKNMYGKKVMGIERSTYLLDEQGMVMKIWRPVKVDGHAAEVLSVIKTAS